MRNWTIPDYIIVAAVAAAVVILVLAGLSEAGGPLHELTVKEAR